GAAGLVRSEFLGEVLDLADDLDGHLLLDRVREQRHHRRRAGGRRHRKLVDGQLGNCGVLAHFRLSSWYCSRGLSLMAPRVQAIWIAAMRSCWRLDMPRRKGSGSAGRMSAPRWGRMRF